MQYDHNQFAQRANAFVALVSVGGLATVAHALGGEESESAGDESILGNAAYQSVKPEVSADIAARRLNMRAGFHNMTDFIATAMFALVDIGVVLLILAFTVAAIYVLPSVIDDILRRFNAPRHIRAIVQTTLRVLIGVGGLWLALNAVGINFLGIVLSFGVVSIVLSNGVGTAISNAVAGMLHNTEDLQPGGRVMIYDVSGTVQEAGFLTLRIQLDDSDKIIVVPNNSFLQMPWFVLPERSPPVQTQSALAHFDLNNKKK